MSDQADDKIVYGPGRERWPGAPKATVESADDGVAGPRLPVPNFNPTARDQKQLRILRLKVISAVQQAALRYSEAEIREMVEQGFRNVRNTSDYS